MSASESLEALRRANPRVRPGFAQSVEAATHAVGAEIAAIGSDAGAGGARPAPPRRRLAGISAVAAVAVAAVAAVFLTVGSPGSGPGVESATAAIKKAATVTAAAAERSGTAVVRITHNGELWAEKAVRWNGADIAIGENTAGRPGRPGDELLVVDGTLYGLDPRVDGSWIAMGSPDNIDPDSGTTPAEYLAAVREDVGGATLRRITHGMTGLTATQLDDGSTVYSGTVAAGLIARESGYKEGETIRVFPFGYVAHDEAADPAAPLDAALTVGSDGVVREIAVAWGTSASDWTYTVTYRDLGTTPAPAAPENARDLLKERGLTRAEPPKPGNGN
jgi:hypothetical protein